MTRFQRFVLRAVFGRSATERGIAARVVERTLQKAGCSRNESKRLTAAVIPALAESGFFPKEDVR